MNNKPFSQSCENNKAPILEQLRCYFSEANSVLEIGSGTGQHAVHFAANLPHLTWQTSDLTVNHDGILAWLADTPSDNLRAPIDFEIGKSEWPVDCDAVFTANTTHIMQPESAKMMMALVAKHLPKHGVFCQYGPFNMAGYYTSESNIAFDQWLADRGHGGIRDIDELHSWSNPHGLQLHAMQPMPANNFLLVWKKVDHF